MELLTFVTCWDPVRSINFTKCTEVLVSDAPEQVVQTDRFTRIHN